RFDGVAGVDRAQAGEHVQRVLREGDAVVLEAERLELAAVTADGAELLGDAYDLLDGLELLERRRRHGVRGAEEIDLGERAGGALPHVQTGRPHGQTRA